MKKFLIATASFLIVVLVALHLQSTNAKLDKEREKRADTQADFDMLETSYEYQQQMLHNAGRGFVGASAEIEKLRKQVAERDAKLADLQRQLQSTPSRSFTRASRSQSAGRPRLSTATTMSSEFWRNLSIGCECKTGDCAHSGGYFQFKGSTATKVGYQPGQSYDVQVQEAIWWAAQIHPHENSRSGWPVCWDQAVRQTRT